MIIKKISNIINAVATKAQKGFGKVFSNFAKKESPKEEVKNEDGNTL